MCPHWGHRALERESLLAVGVSGNWAGRTGGRDADMKTGVEDVGKAGSVAPGRMGTVLAGCLLGNPGVPALPSMSRWAVT